MRLRRKPWIDEAILDYASFVHLEHCEEYKGKWRELFEDPDKPLWVELGTGKGNFISQMAQLHPEANFIGIEIQVGVLYYAGKKCAAAEVNNVHLLRFDPERRLHYMQRIQQMEAAQRDRGFGAARMADTL